jgi:Domain of unknown function (DUF4386)
MQPTLTLSTGSPLTIKAGLSRPSLARLAGLLYLVLAICGGFSELFVRSSIRVDGDAAATADNIRASATLFRVGFVTDLINIGCFVLLGFALFLLLSPVNRRVAMTFVVLVAIAAAIMSLNMLNHIGALLVATDPAYVSAFGAAAADGLALLLLDLHRHGYLIAQIFFGGWLLPLGWLVYRSRFLPAWLGMLVMLGGASYLLDLVVIYTSPGFESSLETFVVLPAAIAEFAFLGWLVVKGVRA